MESGHSVVLDQRIATDIEEFWDHYQSQTLPKVFRTIMSGVHGELRPEFAPPFDTLKIDFHLSEPNYELGIDKERISSLEALQEDTYYSTENFMNMMGDLETGRAITYVGRFFRLCMPQMTAKTGTCTLSSMLSPPGIRWSNSRGPTRRASVMNSSATSGYC